MSTATERLIREADDIRALAGEHEDEGGHVTHYTLIELILRLVAKALEESTEERAA